MKTCLHPYCDTPAKLLGKFCCESCKVSFHQNHKARMQALEAWLVHQAHASASLDQGAAIAKAAREIYRVAHGYLPSAVEKARASLPVPRSTQTALALEVETSQTLARCPRCKRGGFTPAGLARHKCRS